MMPDSEQKDLTIPWKTGEKPAVQRDENGRFLKGTSGNAGNVSPGQAVARWFAKALEGVNPKDPESRTKLEVLFDNMFNIATSTESKYRKEAVWAFNALMDRAYGPPLKDKSELDAMREQAGVKIQVVAISPLPPSSQPQVKPQLQPPTEWEEGEIIDG
jgi:hypothetical protein